MPTNGNKDIGSWDMSLNEGMNETFNEHYTKSIWKKSKPWKQLSDVLEMNSLTLMKVLTFFSEIFP